MMSDKSTVNLIRAELKKLKETTDDEKLKGFCHHLLLETKGLLNYIKERDDGD